MCFSPTVSFAAGAGLLAVGILTLKKATVRQEMLFASMPLLFAVQQFIEGMLWLVLRQAEPVEFPQYWLTQAYAIFAGMVWPALVPLSLWMIEPDSRRRGLMIGILFIGSGIALYTLTGMIRFGITARIADYCILYEYPVKLSDTLLVAYVFATSMGFFISSHRGIQWIGAANMLAFLTAYHFYYYHLVSVWCLFAAIVSGLIYVYFARLPKENP